MPLSHWLPLAPAGLLLLGALLMLASDRIPAAHHRRWLGGGVAVTVLLCELIVFWFGEERAASAVLAPWLDEAGLSLRLTSPNPIEWIILISAVGAAITMARRPASAGICAASLFLLAALGLVVTRAVDSRTLAPCVFAFDTAVAGLLLASHRHKLALARVLLGVAQATALMAVSGTLAPLGEGRSLGDVFGVLLWVRVGLYPLVEAEQVESGDLAPLMLGWHAVQLAVGMYLAQSGLAPWLLWPIVGTTLLHGALAWLAKNREMGMVHATYALAGTALAGLTLGTPPAGAPAAGAVLVSALLAVTLAGSRSASLKGAHTSRVWRQLVNFLPLLLATLSLIGLPYTLGVGVWGRTFAQAWNEGSLVALVLLVLSQGAGLSVLSRYWRSVWQPRDGSPISVVRLAAATLAAIPFLVPVLAPNVWAGSWSGAGALNDATPGPSGWIGLGAALLWAVFLGVGQPVIMRRLSMRRSVVCRWLRLEPVITGGLLLLRFFGTVLLRLRVVFEGEHYLGWAVLLLFLGLVLALVHGSAVLR